MDEQMEQDDCKFLLLLFTKIIILVKNLYEVEK